ncbi:type II/IV secretion system protein [Candidatus Nomurabacteria bacterium]|nr:type II/IV secretion system protein [Candidatus Nomurabacteria bacterium]USN94657.1 MAG: type II/IV secretion system protein [Candidatus Nomurabacteria bacterium]
MPLGDSDIQLKKLNDLKKEEEEDLVKVLAEAKYNLPYMNLREVVVDNAALRFVDEKEAKESGVAPFKLIGKNIYLGVLSPNNENISKIVESIERKNYTVYLYMISHASAEKVWERYKELSISKETRGGSLDISGETLLSYRERISSVSDIPKILEEASKDKLHKVSLILEIILGGAIATNASDIHIEPEEEMVKIRYRLDGALNDIHYISHDIYKLLNSRIKLLSGVKLTLKSIAQDGRFSINIEEKEINIRTSIIPGAYGESIVMRLLDPDTIKTKLEDLGIDKRLFTIIEKEIAKPNGLILLTGPTGSGKTTTLYAFLQRIYSPEKKIITIEDPIEYHLRGITQTQVDNKKGYTFLEGLRSSLRQDPDIIMVGEIRDAETAKIAVESSLTGHLVFSTLHTNNAAGVVPRLIDLEVNPKTIPSSLNLSIAQRLVRKLCENCKKEVSLDEEKENLVRGIIKDGISEGKNFSDYGINENMEIKVYQPVGCDKCSGIGYKGRIGIFEAMYMGDPELEKIIPNNPSEREIKEISDKQGLLDMKEDGIIKVLLGVTSFEEVAETVDLYKD